jgi:hypothetical protein
MSGGSGAPQGSPERGASRSLEWGPEDLLGRGIPLGSNLTSARLQSIYNRGNLDFKWRPQCRSENRDSQPIGLSSEIAALRQDADMTRFYLQPARSLLEHVKRTDAAIACGGSDAGRKLWQR